MTIKAKFYIKRDDFSLDIDITLPAQGVTAIFGHSGCGKTTLLRAIAGLESDCKGSLKVGNEFWQNDDYSLPPHQRPIGYVFQEASLFAHLNVQQNLEYGIKRLGSSRQKYLKKTHNKETHVNQSYSLHYIIKLLGIGHLLDRKPHHLSGGEQQRVAIARALAVNPAMLLLDEPLAALDMLRKQEILPYLESLSQELDIPILYVSHSRTEVARLGDYLLLLENGRIQAEGTVSDLFSRLDLTLAHGADTETVIKAIVSGYDEEFELNYLDFSHGRFFAAGKQLPQGSHARLQVLARDVSITLEHQSKTSILNIFVTRIDAMRAEGSAQITLRLMIGSTAILARITRKSAIELDLQIGQQVYAQVKSVALLN